MALPILQEAQRHLNHAIKATEKKDWMLAQAEIKEIVLWSLLAYGEAAAQNERHSENSP